MIALPVWYDNSSHQIALVQIEIEPVTRLMVGADGIFIDKSGNQWFGSQLLQSGEISMATNLSAPSGRLQMAYLQDPALPDLAADVRHNASQLVGAKLRHYLQPLRSLDEMYAPEAAPILIATRAIRTISALAEGDIKRVITLETEGPFERRNRRQGLVFNRDDHERLIGEANPSLFSIPQEVSARSERLFG